MEYPTESIATFEPGKPDLSLITNLRKQRPEIVKEITTQLKFEGSDQTEKYLAGNTNSLNKCLQDEQTINSLANDTGKSLSVLRGDLTEEEGLYATIYTLSKQAFSDQSYVHDPSKINELFMAQFRNAMKVKGTPLGDFAGKSLPRSVIKTPFALLVSPFNVLRSLFTHGAPRHGTDIFGKRLQAIESVCDRLFYPPVTESLAEARAQVFAPLLSKESQRQMNKSHQESVKYAELSAQICPELNREFGYHFAGISETGIYQVTKLLDQVRPEIYKHISKGTSLIDKEHLIQAVALQLGQAVRNLESGPLLHSGADNMICSLDKKSDESFTEPRFNKIIKLRNGMTQSVNTLSSSFVFKSILEQLEATDKWNSMTTAETADLNLILRKLGLKDRGVEGEVVFDKPNHRIMLQSKGRNSTQPTSRRPTSGWPTSGRPTSPPSQKKTF